jgi:hypothetical protein
VPEAQALPAAANGEWPKPTPERILMLMDNSFAIWRLASATARPQPLADSLI